MINAQAKYAAINLGGKQHLVLVGSKITAEKIDLDQGAELEAKDILSGQDVVLKVVAQTTDKKIHGLKFHSKSRYTRRYGHKQPKTILEVLAIGRQPETVKKPKEKEELAKNSRKQTKALPTKAKTKAKKIEKADA